MFHLLIVEDDRNLRDLLVTVLKRNGYTAHPAQDGREALEIMDHQHIDLVITDIMMPDVDGYELTASLRQVNSDLPVIMVTAKAVSYTHLDVYKRQVMYSG